MFVTLLDYFHDLLHTPVAVLSKVNITAACTIPIDIGNDVAGMPVSPLRHSIDHWYGGIPEQGMAGAGPNYH